MSYVTNILLCTSIDDSGADLLEAYLIETHGIACELMRLDQHAGGNKAMEASVYGVAINYCDIGELLEKFRVIEWESPESVQLLIKDQHDDVFSVHTIQEPT